jgi:hypothetical protein
MIFDRYVTVDWSASNRPKTGKDSVWICSLGDDGEPSVTNPPTRRTAEAAVRDLLVDAVESGERVLTGFDFPYAYPIGFAAALGLDGQPWRAVWMFCPNAISSGRPPTRFAPARRASARTSSVWMLVSNAPPRLALLQARYSAIASMSDRGTCVPPGASANTTGRPSRVRASPGKRSRTGERSAGAPTRLLYPAEVQ